MKVFRFMSKDEFNKYQDGKVLVNNKNHHQEDNRRTESKGFCFLNLDDYTPEEAIHFLSGIVSFDICAVFETDTKLHKSKGVYAQPIKSTGNFLEDIINLYQRFDQKFTATEYCIDEYSNRRFKLLKYSEDIWKQWNPRDEQSELEWKEDEINEQTTRNKINECTKSRI